MVIASSHQDGGQKLAHNKCLLRYVIDQSVTLRLWVVPRGGGSGMLSVWVESRSSPNLAQVGGRVWGYAGCEGQQEHHLYTCTNFNLNRDAALAEWRQLLRA